ncbi:MAG: CrcB family protein, partial [Pseudomonadota bacterium]
MAKTAIWLSVAMGGALGALSRYAMIDYIKTMTGSHLPWGVLWVNCLGCFLAGLCSVILEHYFQLPWVRAFVMSGFLGAMTTFSTLVFDLYILGIQNQLSAFSWLVFA